MNNEDEIKREAWEAWCRENPHDNATARLFELSRGEDCSFTAQERSAFEYLHTAAGYTQEQVHELMEELDSPFDGYLEVEMLVSYLVNSGGQLEATNDKGATPLLVACQHKQEWMGSVLLRQGATVNNAMLLRIGRTSWWDILDEIQLCAPGAISPERASDWLPRVIDGFISSRPQDKVVALLEAGASVTGDMLIEACRRGDDELAALLLEHGADPDARRKGCWSAFAYAKRNREWMPATWTAMTRHALAKKAASKRRSRVWASGQALPHRRAM